MDIEKFGGFTPPVSNYFRMPNEWINICSEITNLAELKVIQYVLRHTWGFHEYDGKPKPITVDEFMHGRKHREGKSRMDKGTGLSEMSVRNGLEKAIEHGYILCESDESDKARIKKSYTLNMLKSEVQDLDPTNQRKSEVQDLGTGVQDLDLKTQTLDLGTKKVRPRSEKDTKERHFKKEKEKETTEPQTSPVSNVLSPSLSSQKNKEEETKTLEVDYSLFDDLCRKKGYAPDFKVSRNEKSDSAIQELRSQGATPEQVEYVFNDIWDDKDPFWKQHRGKPSTVASQFTARVWKMSQSAPTAKRRSVSGFTNYTEDKTAGAPTPRPARVVPEEQEKPKEPSLPVGYTRMQFNDPKPARARSLQARLQQREQ